MLSILVLTSVTFKGFNDLEWRNDLRRTAIKRLNELHATGSWLSDFDRTR